MVIVTKRPLSLICSMTGGLLQCQRLLFGRSCVRHLGVTSRLLQKNFYEVLGLDNDASSSDIKNAYYQLSKKYHPDVCDDQESIQKFHEVSQAYDVLGKNLFTQLHWTLTSTHKSAKCFKNASGCSEQSI